MIQKWVMGIEQLAVIATRFPHSAYAGLVLCLNAEWQNICQTVPDVGPSLTPVENALARSSCLQFFASKDPLTTNSEHSLEMELRPEDW
ncbi:hypothetical protein ACHAW6_001758 [Cyclotella cf. meneghiniana]